MNKIIRVNVFRVALVMMLPMLLSCSGASRPRATQTESASSYYTGTKGIVRKGVVHMTTVKGEQIELYKNSYALLIGVSDYTNGWPSLTAIPDELDDVERALNNQGFTRVIRVNNPNEQQLKNAFDSFIDEYGYDEDNRLLFFYSGHGHSFKGDTRGYLVPTDAPDPRSDKRGFLRKALSMQQIMTWSRNMYAKHALFLFDSCFSGTVFQTKALEDTPVYISRLNAKPVRQYITAGNEKDEVPASSTFTPAFVSGLEDRLADRNQDGYITGSELGMYLQETVPQSVRQMPQYGKISDFKLKQGDFIFVVDNSHDIIPKQKIRVKPYSPPPPPLAVTGSLQVNVYVPEATVSVNGRHYQVRQGKPLNLNALPVGELEIAVTAQGYQTEKRAVAITAGQWVQPQFYLKPDKPPQPLKPRIAQGFVEIQAGCFQMGSPLSEENREGDEKRHRVCVDSFQLGKKEVTVGEFRRFVSATGYRTQAEKNKEKQGCYDYSSSDNKWAWRAGYYWDKVGFGQNDRHPVVCVSWYDVQRYISWLNEGSEGGYRLPTEAEWEYAARAGTQTAYFWSNKVDSKACRYANVADKAHEWSNHFPCDDGKKFTNTVGSYRANDFGLYDISGNVWEWTCSKYKQYAGGEKRCLSNKHANDGDMLVLRGGSFSNFPRWLRVADRLRNGPWKRSDGTGFRLARTP